MLIVLVAMLLSGCGTMELGKTPVEERLRSDMLKIESAWTNAGREEAIREILIRDKIPFVEHSISWHTNRVNFEIGTRRGTPGGRDDVLFGAWHDASDSLLSMLRTVSKGVIDLPPMTNGALDNASGCVVALELARQGRWCLIAGEHQSGHLGARSFAANLEVWPGNVVTLFHLGGSRPEGYSVGPLTFDTSDGIAWKMWSPASSLLSEAPWGALPRASWIDWRSTHISVVMGPPPGFVMDQLLVSAQSMFFMSALPITRYHGIPDTSGNLSAAFLADAVLLCKNPGLQKVWQAQDEKDGK